MTSHTLLAAVSGLFCLTVTGPHPLAGQEVAADLRRERDELAGWLATAPLSPYGAIALQPIGEGLTIGGAASELPLPEVSAGTVREENGVAVLTIDGRRRTLPRGRPVSVPPYTLLTAGTSGRTTLAVFGPPRQPPRPTYYPVEQGLIVTAHLEPPERRGAFAVLGLDGMETSAVEAGVFRGQLAGTEFRLRVYLLQDSGSEESSLYVFFQDPTNDRGSYPGGRFVELLPEKDGAYRLDFNRARNPFCAYNTVFPCPAPWPGNRLTLPVPAGERYIKPSRGS